MTKPVWQLLHANYVVILNVENVHQQSTQILRKHTHTSYHALWSRDDDLHAVINFCIHHSSFPGAILLHAEGMFHMWKCFTPLIQHITLARTYISACKAAGAVFSHPPATVLWITAHILCEIGLVDVPKCFVEVGTSGKYLCMVGFFFFFFASSNNAYTHI